MIIWEIEYERSKCSTTKGVEHFFKVCLEVTTIISLEIKKLPIYTKEFLSDWRENFILF